MTAPPPSSRTSPTAGLINALAALHNRLARQRIAELEEAIVAADRLQTELTKAATTRASYEQSLAAGYIDYDFLRVS